MKQDDYRILQSEKGLKIFKALLEKVLDTEFWVWEVRRTHSGGPPFFKYRIHYSNSDVDDEYDSRGGYLMIDGDLLQQLGELWADIEWRKGEATDPLSALLGDKRSIQEKLREMGANEQ